MFVVYLHYTNPEATWALRDEHKAWGTGHAAHGRILLSGPLVPRTGGIIVANVATRDELDAMLLGDPYATVGTTYEIVEFAASNGCLLQQIHG